MSRVRIAAGAAGVLLGMGFTSGVAAAQVGNEPLGSNASGPPGLVEPNNLTSNAPANLQNTQSSNAATPVSATRAPEGSLPITGGDVAGLVILGAAAVGAGTVMIRRTRNTA